MHSIDIVAACDSWQLELSPEYPQSGIANSGRSDLNRRRRRQALQAFGVDALTGDDEVGIEATDHRIHISPELVVSARCRRGIDKNEHARTAGGDGRAGNASLLHGATLGR